MKTPRSPAERLSIMRREVKIQSRPQTAPYPRFILFFSVGEGATRARVDVATGASFEAAWQQGLHRVLQHRSPATWIRVDWPVEIERSNWSDLRQVLEATKRNYFRLGLSLDTHFSQAFLEQELNANAMLYGGNRIDTALLNGKNFLTYFRTRFPEDGEPDFDDDKPVYLFSSEGVFSEKENVFPLYPTGLDAGRRVMNELGPGDVTALIERGSTYLAHQVLPDGTFIYGHHPCFDRQIKTYNTLRHASTTYSMIEAFEVTGDEVLRKAIERSIGKLTRSLIRRIALPDGTAGAFLIEPNNEIKLGGNAVALLALTQYQKAFDTDRHRPLMDALAEGICHMQDKRTGAFCHILTYPDLSLKEQHRTIYYEGEAAFALLRFYEVSRESRWLDAVELAFGRFIAQDYTRHHDHWLAYAANELTKYRPKEPYFRFAIENVSGYLDFVANRVTTYPTLLELMMAASETLSRLNALGAFPELSVDRAAFENALEQRAKYLLNGHFWPEYAMYMRHPDRILGSFFIRHHGFRVRIDDVEHYLSGLIAYRKRALQHMPATVSRDHSNCTAEQKETKAIPAFKENLPSPPINVRRSIS